nr:hypothetical protein [Tanacetum cinerariifolium]
MGEMTFFLGLQVNQFPCGIFINQSNYVLEILKKYGMESCNPVGTPMEIKDKLDLDLNETPVDATKYHSMIGALMYLTSSRSDIVHATCLCARYQAKLTKKHLKEVKKIFCCLRGTVNTGLWYSKDSGFELTGFSDVDYAGCKDTFKSTSNGAQFLGENKIPIYFDSKSAIAISCNLVQHSRTKHIAVRYHFIKVSPDAIDSGPIFDKEPEQKIDQYDEDADLAEERELLDSLIEKLKCEIDESKKRNTFLETSNKVLVEKLKSELEDFRNKNKSLTEANNKLSKENDLLYADFKKSKAELKRRDSIEYASEIGT